MERTIFYPTDDQQKALKSWLFGQIQSVLNEGTKEKTFTFETSDLEFPHDFISVDCKIRAEVTINYNYSTPQREVDADISVCPIIGYYEDCDQVIFLDTKEFENLKNYE